MNSDTKLRKYRFKAPERIAIWKSDGNKCFYCSETVSYRDLHIDHIVPEDASRELLVRVKSILGDEFELNSIGNWVTCHQGCNRRKSDIVFDEKAIIFYTQIAAVRRPKVEELIRDLQIRRSHDDILAQLALGLSTGALRRDEVQSVLDDSAAPVAINAAADDPWVISFGVNLYNALSVETPNSDPDLSDWLINNLERDIAATGAVMGRLDDDRTGETTGVRFIMSQFDLDLILSRIDFSWEILAAQKYSEVFPNS